MSNQDIQISSANQPTFVAYHVADGNESGFWTSIGAAWPHKDGKGFTLQLNCLPLNGRVILRPNPGQQN